MKISEIHILQHDLAVRNGSFGFGRGAISSWSNDAN